MSNKLYYKLGLEELTDPVEDTPVDEVGTVEAAAEKQTDIQTDLGDIEKLQDDNETLQQAAVALENALKNGHPAESLTFIRQTIHRIDNRWGMHHRIASMESASSDAELIASMESAVVDGIKKTGKAIWEMLKRVWAKLKEWVGLLIEKIGNGGKKLGAKLKRSKELVEIVPKEKTHEVDYALLEQAIGESTVARTLEMFNVDDAGGCGGVAVLEHITANIDSVINAMTGSFSLLWLLANKLKPSSTVEDAGEIVTEYVDDVLPRRYTGESSLKAALGAPDVWILHPLLSIGYGGAVINGGDYGKHNPTPPTPRLMIHKTNYYDRISKEIPDQAAVAKRLIITSPADMVKVGAAHEKFTEVVKNAVEHCDKIYREHSAKLATFCDSIPEGSNLSLNSYLRKLISESGSSVTSLFSSLAGYQAVVLHMTETYVIVMNRYWELVAKKTKPTE